MIRENMGSVFAAGLVREVERGGGRQGGIVYREGKHKIPCFHSSPTKASGAEAGTRYNRTRWDGWDRM